MRHVLLALLCACVPADSVDAPADTEQPSESDSEAPPDSDDTAPAGPAAEVYTLADLGIAFAPVTLPTTWTGRPTVRPTESEVPNRSARHHELWAPLDDGHRVIATSFLDVAACGTEAHPILDLDSMQTNGCLDILSASRGISSGALRGDYLLLGGTSEGSVQIMRRHESDYVRIGSFDRPPGRSVRAMTFVPREDVDGFLITSEDPEEVGGETPGGIYGFNLLGNQLFLTERLLVIECDGQPYTFAYVPAGANTGSLIVTRGEPHTVLRLGGEDVVQELFAVSDTLQLTAHEPFNENAEFMNTAPGLQGKLSVVAPMGVLIFRDAVADRVTMVVSSTHDEDPSFELPDWPLVGPDLPELTHDLRITGDLPTPGYPEQGTYVREWGMLAVTIVARIEGDPRSWTVIVSAAGDDGETAEDQLIPLDEMGLFLFTQVLTGGTLPDGSVLPTGSFARSAPLGQLPSDQQVDVPLPNARDVHAAHDGTLMVGTAHNDPSHRAPAALFRLVPETDRCQVWASAPANGQDTHFTVRVDAGSETLEVPLIHLSHGVRFGHDPQGLSQLLITCDDLAPSAEQTHQVVPAAR